MAVTETQTGYETIEFGVHSHVATITLDRPARLNSFNRVMAAEMSQAWERVRDDDDIRVAVLQANGERAFCTGIDVKEGSWWSGQNIWNQSDPGAFLGPKHHRVWKPVVAAVQGMCAGGGQYFINEADIVICSEDATFFDPHANGGIVSALEPIGLLYRGVPLGDVLRWALTGNEERIGATTALRLGLVSEVVATTDLRARARSLADGIAARRPEAVQGTVRAIWEALEMTRTMALQNGLAYTHIGNPGPGEARSVYPLEGDVMVR
jgi:enoyl-CoA hydratase/carnithine racemase